MAGTVLEIVYRIFNKAILLFLLLQPSAPAAASNCNLDSSTDPNSIERVTVDRVVDGDTVRLQNHRLVRFIGVNTPEIDHEKGNSEPLAEAARVYLQTLIDRQQGFILLKYGRELEDRHGRLLAHVFTPQGENIQALLIAKGLGVWIAVPPNLAYLDCYRQQEQKARQQHLGVWTAQFRSPYDTASLGRQNRGFVWMRGKVTRIGKGKKYLWLNFGEKVAAQVHKDDLHYFEDPTFVSLKNKTVTIKGWLYPYKKQLVMRLHHPASMEVLD